MPELVCMRCGALLDTEPGAEAVCAQAGQLRCGQCETVHVHEAAPTRRETPLSAGEPVLAQWAGRWWRAELAEPVEGDRWRVRFLGWSDEFTQELGPEQLGPVTGGAPIRRWTWVLVAVALAVLAGTGVLLANKGKLVASAATAVEADTVLGVGQAVEIEREGVWVAGEVVGVNENGTVLVRYLDRGAMGDENVVRARLRLP